jgi:hypothetical protein
MQTSDLTKIVVQKTLRLIDNMEVAAFEKGTPLRAENYLKLANLYHFHKEFTKEREILVRFTESSLAFEEDLMEVYERIEHISKTIHVVPEVETSAHPEDLLSLVAIESEPDIVELSSNSKVTHKHKNDESNLNGKTIKVASVCAVYTGRKDEDEIIQLSIVLTQYAQGSESPFHILETYTGNRKTLITPPQKILTKFNIRDNAYETRPLDKAKLLRIFSDADYVVSHNNPNIERRFIVTLLPQLINSKWYSTQKDIPWRALGYDSTSLSKISLALGKRKPRTSLERAKAISQLLQHHEPSNNHFLIERIHYMKPMQSIEMTKAMKQQHKKMARKSTSGWLVLIVALLSSGAVGLWYFGIV